MLASASTILKSLARGLQLVVGDGAIWTEGELFQKLEARYGVRVDIDPHGHDD